jgi:hypothetical protein
MKRIFGLTLKIRVTFLVFLGLVFLSIIVYIWFKNSSTTSSATILGSLFAGIIVAIIQFIIAWQDYSSTEKLHELRLIQVLLNRDKRDFYEAFIRSAKKKIDMMGVTGSRFMDHFANNDSNAPENAKVLMQVMSRGVDVRILLPKSEFLSSDEEKRNEKNACSRIKNILSQYPNKFQVKYFSHVPGHSVFMVDDECIVGPVFPEVSSKFTPALYLKNSSPFAEKYLDYFNKEWENAESI